MRMRVFMKKMRVEIENETRIFLESLNFEIEMRVSQKSGGWPQDPTQMSGEVRNKFQMTNFTMPNNSCYMKYALK